jgi:hypothetical protein
MTGNQFRHPAIDEWIAEVDDLLAEQREHSISPSEGGQLPGIGEVQKWSTTVGDVATSVEQLLDRLTNDPGRWVLVLEIDEAHDRFLRGVFYEDGSLVVETLGNRFLHGEFQLSAGQSADLTGLGWKEPLPDGRATWAFIEATHSPDIGKVAEAVTNTLHRVFGCLDSDPLILKLSSLTERGETAASERPLAQPIPEPLDPGHWPQPIRTAQQDSPSMPRQWTEPWEAYWEVMYPEPTGPVSAFGRWKRLTTGRNVARTYWAARERARERWYALPHTTGEWGLLHPPVVLWMPVCAEPACLGCTWLGGGATIEEAAELARRHSLDAGANPSVVQHLAVPISARNGPTDEPLGRSSVAPPLPNGPHIEHLSTGPLWDHHDPGAFGCVSSAVVDLDPPASHPEGPATLLYLDVEVEGDGDGFIWRCGISDEEAGFGEADWGRGGAVSVEQAEIDCWETVVDVLRDDGYSPDEIIWSVAGVAP